jgi:hypothetical protein
LRQNIRRVNISDSTHSLAFIPILSFLFTPRLNHTTLNPCSLSLSYSYPRPESSRLQPHDDDLHFSFQCNGNGNVLSRLPRAPRPPPLRAVRRRRRAFSSELHVGLLHDLLHGIGFHHHDLRVDHLHNGEARRLRARDDFGSMAAVAAWVLLYGGAGPPLQHRRSYSTTVARVLLYDSGEQGWI